MDKIAHIAKRHRSSVAFVFNKYGIKAMPNPKDLGAAFAALKDTDFYRDLNNAILKQSLGHSNFEDNYDYYISADDSYDDGGETVGLYYDEDENYDFASGKEKRRARKIKRKAKKGSKKSAVPGLGGTTSTPGIDNAEIMEESAGRTGEEKAAMAGGIISNLLTAGSNIAGAVMGRSSAQDSTGMELAADGSGEAPATTGAKKYMPYIIGGVLLLGVFGALIFFLKRKK